MGVPPDLQLSSRDVASLIVIGVYIILIGIMWNAPVLRNILYPFKVLLIRDLLLSVMLRARFSQQSTSRSMITAWVQVLTVAFHESGHVLAGLATCARITSVEVDPELGGLTQMRGGIQWITLPAGAHFALPLHEHNGLPHCTSAWLWGPCGKV